MEQKKGYEKYKESFRKICVNSCVACGLALLTMVLAFVVPFFAYKEEVFGEKVTVDSFSLFDETKWAFKLNAPRKFISIFSLFFLFLYLANAAQMIYDLILSKKRLSDVEKYSLEEYEKIKANIPEKKRIFFKKRSVGGAVLENAFMICVYIFVMKYGVKSSRGTKLDGFWGYLSLCNSLTWGIAIVAILAILAYCISLKAKNEYNKIKTEILLEAKGSDEKENKQKA